MNLMISFLVSLDESRNSKLELLFVSILMFSNNRNENEN